MCSFRKHTKLVPFPDFIHSQRLENSGTLCARRKLLLGGRKLGRPACLLLSRAWEGRPLLKSLVTGSGHPIAVAVGYQMCKEEEKKKHFVRQEPSVFNVPLGQ